ncbi:hypothetical protein F2P56_034541 [Juglans regia]|uniref:RNase H type-1 domain-containing protein n=1 Tax=Juglans regia TaxID=51240 RepID=A0A833WU85_JUGRE|nr:hypothetical protein F2P56_034541 [Juglans regia]
MHNMQCKLYGRDGFMALKLGMSKAYDRIKGSFLEAIMEKVGFARSWIELIMRCVTTVSYSLLINGKPHRKFKPTRDDRLLCSRANTLEWSRLINLSETYELASSRRLDKEHWHAKWEPPPPGFLKLNVDGVMFADVGKAGIGVILRNKEGQVVMAAIKKEDMADEPATIELIAWLRGLQLCLPLGISKLVVEFDCLLLVQELQESHEFSSTNGNLLKDVRDLMKHFNELHIKHVYREGNGVAHSLARFAWNVVDIQMWWDYVPAFVNHALWFDKFAM